MSQDVQMATRLDCQTLGTESTIPTADLPWVHGRLRKLSAAWQSLSIRLEMFSKFTERWHGIPSQRLLHFHQVTTALVQSSVFFKFVFDFARMQPSTFRFCFQLTVLRFSTWELRCLPWGWLWTSRAFWICIQILWSTSFLAVYLGNWQDPQDQWKQTTWCVDLQMFEDDFFEKFSQFFKSCVFVLPQFVSFEFYCKTLARPSAKRIFQAQIWNWTLPSKALLSSCGAIGGTTSTSCWTCQSLPFPNMRPEPWNAMKLNDFVKFTFVHISHSLVFFIMFLLKSSSTFIPLRGICAGEALGTKQL